MKKTKFVTAWLVFLISCISLPHNLLGITNGIPEIGTKELKDKLDHGEPMVLANALSSIEFKNLTIKGSINIPVSKVTADNPLMPMDKDQLLVFFCKGMICVKSTEAAKKAINLGYTNVKIYHPGLPDWIRHRYPVTRAVQYPQVEIPRMYPQEVYEKLDKLVLLDIRGEESKQIGVIRPGVVINISLDYFEEEFNVLPKGKTIVLIDIAGKQVDICGRFLVYKGYTSLVAMEGGAPAWIKMIRRMERKNSSEKLHE